MFKHQVCKYLVSNSTNMSHFQQFEVVDRCSVTQLQVGEFFFFNVACNVRVIGYWQFLLNSVKRSDVTENRFKWELGENKVI